MSEEDPFIYVCPVHGGVPAHAVLMAESPCSKAGVSYVCPKCVPPEYMKDICDNYADEGDAEDRITRRLREAREEGAREARLSILQDIEIRADIAHRLHLHEAGSALKRFAEDIRFRYGIKAE